MKILEARQLVQDLQVNLNIKLTINFFTSIMIKKIGQTYTMAQT